MKICHIESLFYMTGSNESGTHDCQTLNPMNPQPHSDTLASRPIVAYLFVFLLAITLFTSNNRFPLFYNPDETVKIDFVAGKQNSLNHPLLLMGTSRVAAQIFHAKSRESMAWTGRFVSALFAVTTVLALMGVARMLGGLAAAWTVGLMLATSPLLLFLAHYMKEDTALVAGLALTCLAITAYLRQPSARGVLLLGAACAAASSGKYVGIVALLAAIPVLWVNPPRDRPGDQRKWFLLFFTAFVLVVGIVNLHYLRHSRDFVRGLSYEINHVTTGHHGLTAVSPVARLVGFYLRYTPWPALLLAGVYLCLFIPTWRRRRCAEWMMLVFPLFYFGLLSVSRIQFARYLLPVTVWTHYLAGMGLVECVRLLPVKKQVHACIGMLVLGAVVLLQGSLCMGVLRQFGDDNRERAARWAAVHLPREARVLEDRYARLSAFKNKKHFGIKMPFEVKNMKWAAEIGSLEEARRQGFTHIAVSSLTYGRLFNKSVKAVDGYDQYLAPYKSFYERLFREGELLWQGDPALRPRIHIFRLLPPGTPTRPTPIRSEEFEDDTLQ